jgi:glycerol-3-phosphate dehydrogenase
MDTRTEVVVVGGGSTGCGVARDLAMRGLDVTLVERGQLTSGATGHMHGLLHSGGRYAVSDRASAAECAAENAVLRETASGCITDTGGLFVQRPADAESYFEEKLEACERCGVPVEVLSGSEARRREPALADEVERAIAVPDAAVDPFRLAVATAVAAEEHGARIATHAEVTDLVCEAGEVVGVEVRHGDGPGKRGTRPGGTERIGADHVVNATGAWAGDLAATAGLNVDIRLSKGAMTVLDTDRVGTVVNWCRPRGQADIVVPHGDACILGTTDEAVDDPESFPEERRETELLVDELSALVPVLSETPTIRSYWGVRPLYEPPGAAADDTTSITRDFALLDHADRDGTAGMTTVVGGKLTTHRLMAERVSDHVCVTLGVGADCRTDEIPLPGAEHEESLEARVDEFGLGSLVGRSRG